MIWMSLVTGLFCLVLLLNQRWSPPLRLQASHCSTFRIMCDIASIAVFCSKSIKYFPGTASKFFFRLLVTIPVAPIITGIIVHFRFHIRRIYYYYYYYYYVSIIPLLFVCQEIIKSNSLRRVDLAWTFAAFSSPRACVETWEGRHRGEALMRQWDK